MSWQPAQILYPDTEQVMCDRTRAVLALLGVTAYVGRTIPATAGHAVVWNRIGGVEPAAIMQCRVFADTEAEVNDLARDLAGRLPSIVDGAPIRHMVQTGFADLGIETQPMRQLLYDVTFKGVQQ